MFNLPGRRHACLTDSRERGCVCVAPSLLASRRLATSVGRSLQYLQVFNSFPAVLPARLLCPKSECFDAASRNTEVSREFDNLSSKAQHSQTMFEALYCAQPQNCPNIVTEVKINHKMESREVPGALCLCIDLFQGADKSVSLRCRTFARLVVFVVLLL